MEKNKKVNMAVEKNRLECPVCFEFYEKKIYQCVEGHTLCDKCILRLETCPVCRTSLKGEARKVRNLALEDLLNDVEMNCPFFDRGCEEQVKRKDIPNHRTTCKYGKEFSLCKLLFECDCDFKVNMGNANMISAHLEREHIKRAVAFDNRNDIIHNRGLKAFFRPGDKVFVWQMKFRKIPENKIVFVAQIKDGFVSWMFFDLSGDDGKATSRIQIKIWSAETPTISWKLPVFPVLDAEKHFKDPINKVSISQLKEIRAVKEDDKSKSNLKYKDIVAPMSEWVTTR